MSPDPLLKSGFERVSKSENIWERATSVLTINVFSVVKTRSAFKI